MAIKHDWLLENLSNPDLDTFELSTLGELNTDNTQFLSKDEYLQFEQIRNQFTNDFGEVDEQAFDNFYNSVAYKWNELQSGEFPKGLELSIFDTSVKPSSRIKDYNFYLGSDLDDYGRPNNPDRIKKGIEGFRTVSDRTKSESEIAQSSKIYDYESKQFLNETPNDRALLSNPIKWLKSISDPLVLATYDEDTVDEYGIKHRKGEYKYNELGTYYYENLGGRSPIGKQVLSVADLVTPESSVLNKIDFFDSDDLRKSVGGVIAKNVALVAPLFTPIAPYYYNAIIAKELVKSLPMLAGMVSLIDSDIETPEWINRVAASGQATSMGVSQYSKQNVFTFENIANLMSDVALQWGQQKQIAKFFSAYSAKDNIKRAEKQAFQYYKNKAKDPRLKSMIATDDALWKESMLGQAALRKFQEPVLDIIGKRQRFGADMSLVYMSLISNQDVYADMINRGATKQEAALVAAGSIIGMFSVDKYLGLGNMFFDDESKALLRESRQVIRKEMSEASKILYAGTKAAEEGGKTTPKKLFKKAFDISKRATTGLVEKIEDGSLSLLGKAVGEGLEEVSEEFMTDISRTLYEFGAYNTMLGYNNTIDSAGAWEHSLERYGMSMLGGFLGGGLHGIVSGTSYNEHIDKDLVTAIRDKKGNDLRNEVKRQIEKGQLGSTTLSGKVSGYDSEGKPIFLTTTNPEESQNQIIGKMILDKINALEATIIGNGAALNDDELFNHMVFQDARYLTLKNASHVTGYYEEYQKRLDKIIQTEDSYKKASKTKSGNPNDTSLLSDSDERNLTDEEKQTRAENLAQLKANVDQAKVEFEDFLSGKTSLWYTRKLNFALDPVLNSVFLGLDYTDWLMKKTNSSNILELMEKLNEDVLDREKLQTEWEEHYKQEILNKIDDGFNAYLNLEQQTVNSLLFQQTLSKNYAELTKTLDNLFKESLDFSEFMKDKSLYNYFSKLSWEDGTEDSDEYVEQLKNKEIALPIIDQYKRQQRTNQLNYELIKQFLQPYEETLQKVNYNVDSATSRQLLQKIELTNKNALAWVLESIPFMFEGSFPEINNQYRNTIFNNLQLDFSNKGQVIKQLNDNYLTQQRINIQNLLSELDKINITHTKSYSSKLRKDIYNEIIIPQLQNNSEQSDIYKQYKQLHDNINTLNILNNTVDSITETPDFDDFDTLDVNLLSGELLELYNRIGAYKNESAEEIKLLQPELDLFKSYIDLELENTNNNLKQLILTNFQENVVSNTTFSKSLLNRIINLSKDNDYTIQEVIELLKDPESNLYKQLHTNYSDLSLQQIAEALEKLKIPFGKDSLFSILHTFDESKLGNTGKLQLKVLQSYLDFVVNEVQKHPIFEFYNKLQTQLHTPLQDLFTAASKLISDDPKNLNNINYILDQVYQDYVSISDVNKFELNPTLTTQLSNASITLDMLKGVIYGASNPTVQGNYFSHNKQINEFVQSHKKELDIDWEPLPELPNDFGMLMLKEVDRLQQEILTWQQMSAQGSMNKAKRLLDVEELDRKIKANLLKQLKLTFTIDAKEYTLNPSEVDVNNITFKDMFKLEKEIHDNFINMLNTAGISVDEFFKRKNTWEIIAGNLNKVKKQLTSKLNENIKELTDYDELMYILTILSDGPANYYKSLKYFIKDNAGIIPITIQQLGSRLAQSAHTSTFKTAFKYLSEYLNIDDLNVTENVVHMNGVGGAGKTEAQLKAIRQRFHEEKAIVIAPTEKQSKKLADILGEGEFYTLNESPLNIFDNVVVDWKTIKQDYDNVLQKLQKAVKDKKAGETFDTKYFTATLVENSKGYNTIFKLKDNVKFNNKFDHTLIFADEAAHKNTLQIVLLNELAKRNKGTVFLASDDNQNGYDNNPVSNLGPEAIFAIRSQKLQESLRSSNIQKQSNDAKLAMYLDTYNDVFNEGNFDNIMDFHNKIPNSAKQFKFRLYDKDDINGYMFGANINEELLKLIPKTKTITRNGIDVQVPTEIGFIGDDTSSEFIQLQKAGFNVSAYSEHMIKQKSHMQGQEFDYVIIGQLDDKPISKDGIQELPNNYNSVLFLRRIYTLATRGKQAAIFVDDLTPYFGSIQSESIKSKTFDISKQFENFSKEYVENLESLNLEEIEEKVVEKEEPKPIHKEKDEVVIPESDNIEDTTDSLKTINNEIHNNILDIESNVGDETTSEPEPISISDKDIQLTIEANLSAPVIGLEQTFEEDGKKLPFPKWLYPAKPKRNEVRRNAAALYFSSEENNGVYYVSDKKDVQFSLSSIQSVVKHGGTLKGALSKFNNIGEVWKNRKLHLEFRKVTESDYFGVGTGLKPSFININGEQYIISLVLELNGLIADAARDSVPFTGLFDICLLNDPKKINDVNEQKRIKAKLQNLLKTGRISKDREQDVHNFCEHLPTIAKEWSSFIDLVIKNHVDEINKDGFKIELNSDDYYFHGITSLHKIGYPIRLGGTLNLSDYENKVQVVDEEGNVTGEYAIDRHTFLDIDNRKVVSPVYIAGNKSEKKLFDESVLGKAVVFVSDDVNLDPEQLPKLWLEQKESSNKTAKVRMVPLINHGVHFMEFVNHGIQKMYEGQGKPHRMNVLGAKMFASLWNFRAGVKQFKKVLEDWQISNNITDKQLTKITSAETDLYYAFKNKNWHNDWKSILDSGNPKVNEILTKYEVSHQDIEKLMNFNLEVCKNIPIYRLGTDQTSSEVGGYVRPFDVQNSNIYKGVKEVNLLTVTKNVALKYEKLLDIILSTITANKPPEEFNKAGLEYAPFGLRIVELDNDDDDAAVTRYIGGGIKSFKGMIKTESDGMVLKQLDVEGQPEFTVDNAHMFSFIPKLLAQMVKGINRYQKNPKAGDFGQLSIIYKKGETDHVDTVNFTIGEFFKDNLIAPDAADNTLFQMLSIIFHGTTGSIENNIETGSRPAYLYDSYFKYGIFVDPELQISKDFQKLNVAGKDGKNWTFLRCDTNPIFFDVNVEVRPGGAMLRLSNIINKYKGIENKPKIDPRADQVQEDSNTLEKFSDTIKDENVKNAFKLYIENNEDAVDSEKGYNEWYERWEDVQLQNYFIGETSNLTNLIEQKIKDKFKDEEVEEITKNGTEVLVKTKKAEYRIFYEYSEIKSEKIKDIIINEKTNTLDEDIKQVFEEILANSEDSAEKNILQALYKNPTNFDASQLDSNFKKFMGNSMKGTPKSIKKKVVDYLSSLNQEC